MIQAGGQKVTDEIHTICNQIWQEGRVPEEWAKSVIVTIPKKGDLAECSNYRTNALLSHVGKVLMMVLLERLKVQMEPHLSEEQVGFRKDRCMTHQILILRLMAEKAKGKGRHIINCFIDFQKAFDSIKQQTSLGQHSSHMSRSKIEQDTAEQLWNLAVSGASWQRNGRLV